MAGLTFGASHQESDPTIEAGRGKALIGLADFSNPTLPLLASQIQRNPISFPTSQ